MSEHKIRLSYLILAIIVFSCGFLSFTYQQLPEYFKKDLISYDESTNSVVSANLYRDYFPPRLRLNSLNDAYDGWKEGPEWQHIPPLFLYVPIPLMKADREISIEVKRLSYVLVAYVQGLLFIIGIALLYREKRAILSATLAAWLWLLTPFVRQVLNANAFGYSDVVLSFSVVLAFLMILGLTQDRFRERPMKRYYFLLTILAATLPLLVKNMLGALPLAMLLAYLLLGVRPERRKAGNIAMAVLIPAAICGLYYGLNFYASPEAFREGFFVSFDHFGDYEGWKRPWHYFISSYLPERYLSFMFWPFVAGLALSVWQLSREENKEVRWLSAGFLLYFVLHLAAITLVTSKSANFLLQSYQFILFFVVYMTVRFLLNKLPALKFTSLIEWMYEVRLGVASIAVVLFGILIYLNVTKTRELRAQPYKYQTKNERFYEFGELCSDVMYSNEQHLFILDTDTLRRTKDQEAEDPDFWFRYYILFNSGSEARRLEELEAFSANFDVEQAIKRKYQKIFWVASDATIRKYYPERANQFTPLGIYKVMRIHPKNIGEFL